MRIIKKALRLLRNTLGLAILLLSFVPVGFLYTWGVYLFTGERITIIARVGTTAELLIIPPIVWILMLGLASLLIGVAFNPPIDP